jgi:hypothetical protein
LHLKTPLAARQLRVSYWRLVDLLRTGRLEPPAKDSSGHYQWGDDDLRRAREVLDGTSRKAVPA